ncbi:trehalose-6-phosphate synthase [Candidatus Kaiserbacteria bacterium]|nr:trehalose-6-phosphate synthase [Candidatus Kaiserbacteria bacterium]
MRQVFLIVFGVIFGVSVVALLFTYFQAQQERFALSADMQYRTRLLADSLNESIEPARQRNATSTLEKIATSFAGRERLLGVVIYDRQGNVIVKSKDVPEDVDVAKRIVEDAIKKDEPVGDFLVVDTMQLYVLAHPVHREEGPAGAFIVVQDASYIEESVAGQWRDSLLGVFIYILLFSVAIAALVRWVIFKPLTNLAEAIKSARAGRGRVSETQHGMFFRPLASEIGKLTHSLAQARTAASEEARMRLEKLDTPWTEERLKEFIKAYLKDRQIFVVSNREPYIHTRDGGEVAYSVPASGMVTALESVMAACGGTWIAHGSGSGDRETADQDGKIQVPPDDPKYMLKRIWLTGKEVKGYYTGFSNEALWPLCHIAHTRPAFRKEDWITYKRVNGLFAKTLLSELKGIERPLILVQDYHLALLPRMIKEARPDAQIGLFWHIPWPSAEAFSICPWRKEILDGMLGSDIIGFHTQQFCNNFIETVGKEVESLIDLEQFAITRDEHITRIKPFPISISFTDAMHEKEAEAPTRASLEALNITTEFVGLGVDRLDYTKGILERLRGVEFFLDAHPEYAHKFTFLQIAPISRGESETYQQFAQSVEKEVSRINTKFSARGGSAFGGKRNGWQPIVLQTRHFSHAELRPLYRLAHACLVTSLHDGMNLVAKEFVAARDDEAGVLILSKFTGASRDFDRGAIIVNPYSAEEVAESIHQALLMPKPEQHRRMKMMRNSIRDYNVYRWAAEFIKAVAALR